MSLRVREKILPAEKIGAAGAKGCSPVLSMNPKWLVLIFNDLRHLTPHP
jgi:hypothetical protein